MKASHRTGSAAGRAVRAPAPVERVLLAQGALALLGLAGSFYDREAGLAVCAGGLLALGPNALAARALFRRARSVRAAGRGLYRAQALRWAATLAGFAAVFALWPGVAAPALFAAYLLALCAPLLWHLGRST